MRRLLILGVVLLLGTLVLAPAALASDQSTKEAAGWVCGGDAGLPPGHCLSPGTVKNFDKTLANGGTFMIMVFDAAGNLLATEGATFKASADNRPCPNDPESPDGTWWSPAPGLYVCHHQPA